ncbi:MAG: hypothetical protein OEY34_00090 [Cyclobacteriaceae bacterium]|nr:hypothetical protein [Cyclobacteriaceae bacterium]
MKNTFFTTILIVTIFSTAVAQETETTPVKKLNINEFYVNTGSIYLTNSTLSLEDFQLLAPQSELINRDFTGYNPSDFLIITNNRMFSVLLGAQISEKDKSSYRKNPQMRLGISYFSGNVFKGGYFKAEKSPFDTLRSNQTTDVIYIDSVVHHNYNMRYSSEQVRLDGSLIFRTNTEARWSAYAGIGITAGVSISASTTANYSQRKSKEMRYPDERSYYMDVFNSTSEHQSEVFENKNNFLLSGYIPMGVDFRVGKKKEFWKMTHLFYEFRPSLQMITISELQTKVNASSQFGMGLRVVW